MLEYRRCICACTGRNVVARDFVSVGTVVVQEVSGEAELHGFVEAKWALPFSKLLTE